MTVEEVFRGKKSSWLLYKISNLLFFTDRFIGRSSLSGVCDTTNNTGRSRPSGICQWFFQAFLTPYNIMHGALPTGTLTELQHCLFSQSLPSKLSQVDISICHFYQEIGLKLRKFWTQYSCKIDNKMSFIIISKHISLRIVHFIGCKLEKLYEFELSCLPIMETWTAHHIIWWWGWPGRYMSYGGV